ncbi:uncharacterized protein [Nothobranchius furzeri]
MTVKGAFERLATQSTLLLGYPLHHLPSRFAVAVLCVGFLSPEGPTETIIQRLERVLSLSGTTSVDPHFITDVILPEALIQWVQTTNVICRFQAEDLLMKTKPFIDNEGKAELAINDDTPKESSILADTLAAAEWVKGTLFEGMVKVPSVLSMDEEEQQEVLEAVQSWNEDHDYDSPAEHLTFAFENKNDYDKFCSFIIDEKNLKVFSRFEVQD